MEDHTFIIPAYKDSLYIEECIVSLQNQTKKSRIIITSPTPSVYLAGISKKFSVELFINSETSNGIAGDWDFALQCAETKFATIAHQDDIYDSTFLESVLQKITDKKVLIVFTDYCEIINGTIRKPSFNFLTKKIMLLPFIISSNIKNNFLKRVPLLFGNAICCPSVTYNKIELSGFSFSSEYTYSLDWNAWLEISKKRGAFVFINKKLMKHRLHPDSETTLQLKANMRKTEEQKILQRLWGKRMGNFISKIYLLSHKDNQI